jgi:2-octaprenyl-6-methoxyphenol hydroxylase
MMPSPDQQAAPETPSTSPTGNTVFDIAIVGAGAVGLVCALAMAEAGFRVALLGPSPSRRDGRTVALLNASWQMLERWGVVKRLAGLAAPLATMRLVDDTGSLFRQPPVDFRSAEIGLDAFGWNVETVQLVAALEAVAEATPDVFRDRRAVADIDFGPDQVVMKTADGLLAKCHLVVGADGRQSLVREAAGIAASNWSYPQVALTTTLRHSREHRDASTEFHTRTGPFTLVPLPGRCSSLVWLVEPAEGERLMALDDTALAAVVEKQSHSMLGAIKIDGPRGLVPMSGLSVPQFSAERVALVGEAAHVFPPIGAQGLNLGFRDVAALVAAMTSGDDRREAVGSPSSLKAYDRSRRVDVATRTGAVDVLNRSLLSDLMPVDLGRGLGLMAIAGIGPLRRMMMRQGLGS